MIRRGLVADASPVHAALVSVRQEIPLADNFSDDAHLQWVRDQCRGRAVWVDDRGGDLVGVMVMRVNEIFYLAVPPAFRRRGVAQALIDHAKLLAVRRRWGGLTAKVRSENTPIVTLIGSLGFAPDPDLIAAAGWEVYSWGAVR